MFIDNLFDADELYLINMAAIIAQTILAVMVMQLWAHGRLAPEIHWTVCHLRRIALWGIALSGLWTLWNLEENATTPWNSDVASRLFVDALLMSSVATAFYRRKLDVAVAVAR